MAKGVRRCEDGKCIGGDGKCGNGDDCGDRHAHWCLEGAVGGSGGGCGSNIQNLDVAHNATRDALTPARMTARVAIGNL